MAAAQAAQLDSCRDFAPYLSVVNHYKNVYVENNGKPVSCASTGVGHAQMQRDYIPTLLCPVPAGTVAQAHTRAYTPTREHWEQAYKVGLRQGSNAGAGVKL